ncbi:natural killer cell receptor 2B4, partial [Antrostomus carolinensis]|uniref:natural killer cell receptor 2B4 n=1 Tax=Antrostomus carolinensis TaxID=279965 RepID=UPI0010A98811
SLECREQAVSTKGTLRLQLEKSPEEWMKMEWRVTLAAGSQNRILTAEKNKNTTYSKGWFFGRVIFQLETLSLEISPVSVTDSGVYRAEFEDTSGFVTTLCFQVSVWDPITQPSLESHILHWEQGWCNLSLLCTVSSTNNVSYNWSCTGSPLGALEPQPWLQLQVPEDTDPIICHCNVSNPVSWGTASTDVVAPCRAAAPESPPGHSQEMLTVYEEVGKAQTSRDHNGTSEATMEGNTIYAVVCPKTRGPSCPQEPQSCTIYSTVHPTKKSPSLKSKKLDPALISTSYVEATGLPRRWCPPVQTLPPAPVSHHLS